MARLSSSATFGALILLSLASFVAFEFNRDSLFAGLGLFAIALIKVNLIIDNFMHLKWRHRPFRQVLLGWTLVVLIILFGGLFLLPWETIIV